MKFASHCAALLATALLPLTAAAQTAPAAAPAGAPIRHLVYGFTWGTDSDLAIHNSAVGTGGSGVSNFHGGNGDQGSITVDILREQADKGLVVMVSEQAQHDRSSLPDKCVIYGTTAVICDASRPVNPEEMTLLRFLGANFVDPALIDSKQHWQIGDSSGSQYSVKADYTISTNKDGVMTIVETREVKQMEAAMVTTHINSTIGYDYNRQLPTEVKEYSVEREGTGQGDQTTTTQTVLTLKSDSLAKG